MQIQKTHANDKLICINLLLQRKYSKPAQGALSSQKTHRQIGIHSLTSNNMNTLQSSMKCDYFFYTSLYKNFLVYCSVTWEQWSKTIFDFQTIFSGTSLLQSDDGQPISIYLVSLNRLSVKRALCRFGTFTLYGLVNEAVFICMCFPEFTSLLGLQRVL